VSTVPLYQDATRAWGLIEADALALLAKLPENSIDCIVTDPPYALGFRHEPWDGQDIRRAVREDGEPASTGESFSRWTSRWAAECKRVLKPGGYLLAFGAPRTFHHLTTGVENAGLDIRDVLLWMFAQGTPKSRRMPAGQGTALKPAYEPILLARDREVGDRRRGAGDIRPQRRPLDGMLDGVPDLVESGVGPWRSQLARNAHRQHPGFVVLAGHDRSKRRRADEVLQHHDISGVLAQRVHQPAVDGFVGAAEPLVVGQDHQQQVF